MQVCWFTASMSISLCSYSVELVCRPSKRFVVYFEVIDFLRMFVLHTDGATLLLKTIETGNGTR
jgi:hypothetical protein